MEAAAAAAAAGAGAGNNFNVGDRVAIVNHPAIRRVIYSPAIIMAREVPEHLAGIWYRFRLPNGQIYWFRNDHLIPWTEDLRVGEFTPGYIPRTERLGKYRVGDMVTIPTYSSRVFRIIGGPYFDSRTQTMLYEVTDGLVAMSIEESRLTHEQTFGRKVVEPRFARAVANIRHGQAIPQLRNSMTRKIGSINFSNAPFTASSKNWFKRKGKGLLNALNPNPLLYENNDEVSAGAGAPAPAAGAGAGAVPVKGKFLPENIASKITGFIYETPEQAREKYRNFTRNQPRPRPSHQRLGGGRLLSKKNLEKIKKGRKFFKTLKTK